MRSLLKIFTPVFTSSNKIFGIFQFGHFWVCSLGLSGPSSDLNGYFFQQFPFVRLGKRPTFLFALVFFPVYVSLSRMEFSSHGFPSFGIWALWVIFPHLFKSFDFAVRAPFFLGDFFRGFNLGVPGGVLFLSSLRALGFPPSWG